jgi:lipoprotein signal peptidase
MKMKKLLIGLFIVILMGAAVSTLQRYTGINLYSAYQIGVICYVIYSCANESKKRNMKAK